MKESMWIYNSEENLNETEKAKGNKIDHSWLFDDDLSLYEKSLPRHHLLTDQNR
jgi:hypothetical protein